MMVEDPESLKSKISQRVRQFRKKLMPMFYILDMYSIRIVSYQSTTVNIQAGRFTPEFARFFIFA